MKYFVTLAITLTVFTQGDTAAMWQQFLPISVFWVMAIYGVFNGHMILIPATTIEYIIIVAVVISMLVSAFAENMLGIQYSVLFGMTMFAFSIVTRSITREELEAAFLIVAISSPVFAIIGNFDEWRTSLSVEITGSGLTRFSPYMMHPNLTGLYYGGCALYAIKAIKKSHARYTKVFFVLSALLSISIVLAASARSGLLAAIAAPIVAKFFNKINLRVIVTTAIVGILGIFVIAFAAESTVGLYVTEILELNSEARGVESGGTGRTELWAVGLNYIIDRSWGAYAGLGFRGATYNRIGFHTENSYITIIIEHGVIIGPVLILGILWAVYVGCARLARRAGETKSTDILGVLLLYVVVQSMFNRYLIAVGNGMSIMAMLCVMKIYLDRLRAVTGR
jgi:O-antigen ligase